MTKFYSTYILIRFHYEYKLIDKHTTMISDL